MMNLSQLKTFIILSECLSVTETAEKLFCTQPAVSIKIKKLEEHLGATLFERENNRLYITEQGKIFRQYALKIQSLIQTGEEHILQYNDPQYGNIYFGASHFVGIHLLPQVMAKYKQDNPNVDLHLNISPVKHLIKHLDDHQLEFIVVSGSIDFDHARYHSHSFFSDEMVLISSPNHPLAKQGYCTLNELSQYHFLTKAKTSETRKFIFSQLDDLVKQHLQLLEINNLEAIKKCVMLDLGIAIVSRIAVEMEIAMGLLVEVKMVDKAFKRKINVVHHNNRFLSPATLQFLKQLDNLN